MDATTINANRTAAPERPKLSSRRRTRRIALKVAVEVSGKDSERSAFSLTTMATNLNRNGAMLHLNRDLSLDSALIIQNSRKARTSVRVVSQTRTAEGVYAYGVEFLEAENVNDFWGIKFPSVS
jgi:hypothetical protein